MISGIVAKKGATGAPSSEGHSGGSPVPAFVGWIGHSTLSRHKAGPPNPENSSSLPSACFLYVSLSLFPGTPRCSVVKLSHHPHLPTRTATSANQLSGLRGSRRDFSLFCGPYSTRRVDNSNTRLAVQMERDPGETSPSFSFIQTMYFVLWVESFDPTRG